MTEIKTQWAGGKYPGGNKWKNLDPGIEITSDPYERKRSVKSKYEPIFKKLKVGQSIKCSSEAAPKISTALKKYIETKGIKGVVRFTANYKAEGVGRVWLLAEDVKGGAQC